jgi:dipeptidyl aminopeptidase/acylaminoacyl peptidase
MISTDTDIYLYNIGTRETTNLCKTEGYVEPKIDATKTMKYQSVNAPENMKNNPGYDQNPQFSPDGKHIAWLSMARNGYESDRQRLCVYDFETGSKKYMTESFDSNVDEFCWSDTKDAMIYFIGVWHATENLYSINWKGEIKQLSSDWADFGSLQMMNNGKQILAERHSYTTPADLYVITPGKAKKSDNAFPMVSSNIKQITQENEHILSQLGKPKVQQRWVNTTDGKQMLYWVILPPNFDENKKYPTLLFCEGGPQSPVSQFWSYRWNFMIMASQGYVVVAPNRHGLPGFGSEWCEQISGDWTGQCMDDYLTAIDDAANNLPYVDKDRLGAVGASFGGFSVYYLAGHHDKRFKCFIAHDGAFNLESMYTDTEEVWFSNWEYDDAFWNKDQTANAKKTYDNSPHKFVDKWDTPILCIHGEKDYRINYNQGMGAFNAARLRGIPAELLIFPDENHWVLKPQNGILWQRTFFNWLDRWLK